MHNHQGEEEEGENVMKMGGKRENSGSRVQVIYAGCIIFNSSAPHPPPPRLSYPPQYLTARPGCAPLHCRTEEGSPATPAMIKILP